MFIAMIGFKNSGIISVAVEAGKDIKAHQYTEVLSFETIFHLGSLEDKGVILTIVGILLISILMVLRVRGAILFGILATTVIGYFMGMVDLGTLTSDKTTWVPDMSKLRFADFDFRRHYDDRDYFGHCNIYVR